MLIRPAVSADCAAIRAILKPVIRAGEAYALDRGTSEDEALAGWLGPDKETSVAEENGRLNVIPVPFDKPGTKPGVVLTSAHPEHVEGWLYTSRLATFSAFS